MQQITLKDVYNQTHTDCLFITSLDDLMDYQGLAEDDMSQAMKKALKSKTPISRWDHLFNAPGQGNGLMAGGVARAYIRDSSPIMEAGVLACQKFDQMRASIRKGEFLVVNQWGGYFPFNKDTMTITDSKEYAEPDKFAYVTIPDNTQIINLENDPELEETSIAFMEERDRNYSSVRRLDKFSEEELVRIFSQFKEKGGHTVYVYTTGINVPQMHEYSRALVSAGLRHVIFDFNAGMTEEIDEVIAYLQSKKIKVWH